MNMKTRLGTGLPVVFCFLVLAWGNPLFGQKGDVPTVKNPKRPVHSGPVLKLTEELRIGEAEGRPEYALGQVDGIAVDSRGRIYVADGKNVHIQVFDDQGVYVRTIGRAGQGPGEIGRPYDVFIDSKDDVLVPDGKNYRLHFYSADGAFLKDLSFGNRFPMQSALGPDGHLFVLNFGGSFDTGTFFELIRLDAELKPIAVIDRVDIPPGPLRIPLGEKIPLFFARSDGSLLLGYSKPKEYRFEVRDPKGKSSLFVTRDFDPVPIPKDLIEKAKQSRAENLQTDIPTQYAAYYRIFSDEAGRTFLLTPPVEPEGKSFTWDMFDRDGRYLAAVKLPGSARLLSNMKNCLLWKAGKLYVVEEDEDGYHVVKRYRAEWTM